MNENEITVTEEVKEEPEIVEEHSGMDAGLAMLIGSGLTLAAIVGVKKLKKVWAKHKAKKEETSQVEEPDEEVIDIEEVKETKESEND